MTYELVGRSKFMKSGQWFLFFILFILFLFSFIIKNVLFSVIFGILLFILIYFSFNLRRFISAGFRNELILHNDRIIMPSLKKIMLTPKQALVEMHFKDIVEIKLKNKTPIPNLKEVVVTGVKHKIIINNKLLSESDFEDVLSRLRSNLSLASLFEE